ncbi:hypothetical protein SELMODRAFT_419296 [Selaginella moellendorffii]|uniref:Uncharacterized protein n=1 Tax=Selaginella moellendorffii TaxID=88036 RepID=D8S8G6_SELML|nr:hypothetical protein SELMODRAFT_419296 [Selaginella moellendorffii]
MAIALELFFRTELKGVTSAHMVTCETNSYSWSPGNDRRLVCRSQTEKNLTRVLKAASHGGGNHCRFNFRYSMFKVPIAIYLPTFMRSSEEFREVELKQRHSDLRGILASED